MGSPISKTCHTLVVTRGTWVAEQVKFADGGVIAIRLSKEMTIKLAEDVRIKVRLEACADMKYRPAVKGAELQMRRPMRGIAKKQWLRYGKSEAYEIWDWVKDIPKEDILLVVYDDIVD